MCIQMIVLYGILIMPIKSSVLLTFDHSASDLINHKETKPEYL